MKARFIRLFGVVFLLLTIVSCSGGGGGDDPTPTPVPTPTSPQITGVASKGIIKGGTVNAYEVVEGVKGTLLGSATTGQDGSYLIDIGSYTGPVLVEVTGGNYTDEATGNEVGLTMTLRAAVSEATGGITVAVTPLTELAVRYASLEDLSPARIASANALLSQLLGGDGNEDLITGTVPVDITDGAACDAANPEQVRYSVLLAAISQASHGVKSIEDFIEEIEEDLEDLSLDETGACLSVASIEFLDGDKNASGLGSADDLFNKLFAAIETVTEGFTPTGELSEIKKKLGDFFADPTEANFDSLMTEFSNLPDSKEAHLFKAMAKLFNLYNNEGLEFIKDELEIDFDTDFDQLDTDAVLEKLFDLIDDGDADEIKNSFRALKKALIELDGDLQQAEGVDTMIAIPGVGTVSLDDVDVKVMRAITQVLKAVCSYVLALNLTVDDWSCQGALDIRDVDSPTDEQWETFLANNGNLLKYSDTSKLNDFKTAIQSASEQITAAVTVLENLGATGRRKRHSYAFNIDNEADFEKMKVINKYVLQSIIKAFTDSDASIKMITTEENDDEKVIVENDGYAYYSRTENISVQAYRHKIDNFSLYDLVTSTSPRDIYDEYGTIAGLDDFRPYTEGAVTLIKGNVKFTEWDDPIKTFTVPLATPAIDGNASDWQNIPAVYDDGSMKIKIARDNSNNFYLYVLKPEGFPVYPNWYSPSDWIEIAASNRSTNYFACAVLSEGVFNGSLFMVGYQNMPYYQWLGDADDYRGILSEGTVVGVEAKFPDMVHRLFKAGSVNMILTHNGSPAKTLKFLQ